MRMKKYLFKKISAAQPLQKIAVPRAADGLCFRGRSQVDPSGLDTYFSALCVAVQATLREIACYAICKQLQVLALLFLL